MNSTRRQLKQHARQMLNSNFKFFAALILPTIIIAFLNGVNRVVYEQHTISGPNSYNIIISGSSVSILINVLIYLLITSVALACLNLVRSQSPFRGGIEQSTTIFHNKHYFWGAIWIGLLQMVWEFFWSLLFVFPGYIKQLAYSQAIYIYKDAVDAGHQIQYRDAITKSRRLMRGHKWELCVIQLSFIGWWIVSIITFSLADFWIRPYYRLTMANFYQKLITDPNNK